MKPYTCEADNLVPVTVEEEAAGPFDDFVKQHLIRPSDFDIFLAGFLAGRKSLISLAAKDAYDPEE